MKYATFDIIGDIHGEADILRDLLARLGYCERAGAHRHPQRCAIFLGDYIDRGPAIRETLHIVRNMVEHRAALALCGNHELDVLMHDTPDSHGGWLRSHGGRHTAMHARTHAEFANRADEWRGWLRWFQSLPLSLELPGFCAVHACWDEAQIAVIRGRRLDDTLLHAVADKTTRESKAVHKMLNGPVTPLPTGVQVAGRERPLSEMRVRWWRDGRGDTYRNACINRHEPGPDLAIPREFDAVLAPPPPNDGRPIFIGHYWMPQEQPAPLTRSVACLDYSVASGGPLVAYRWDGERSLSPEKFVFDPKRLAVYGKAPTQEISSAARKTQTRRIREDRGIVETQGVIKCGA